MTQTIDPELSRQFDRLPPASLEAERATLSCMMLTGDDTTAFDQIRIAVGNRDSWYQADHQIIYDQLCWLRQAGKPVDLLMARERLKDAGLLEEMGGVPYLAEVYASCPSGGADRGAYYASIVREKAMLRKLITIANSATASAYAPTDTPEHADNIGRRVIDQILAMAHATEATSYHHIAEVLMELIDSMDSPGSAYLKTGLRDIDAATGGIPMDGFTLIGGRPGMGKSLLLKTIAMHIAQQGDPVGIITLEEGRQKIAGNYAVNQLQIDNQRMMRRELDANQLDGLVGLGPSWQELPIYIADACESVRQVEAMATLLKAKENVKAIFIDYIQLIEGGGENRNAEVTTISRGIKRLGKRLNVATVAAAQLNRGNESQGVRRPLMRDLRDSGSLDQDGDLIILLHREDYYHKGEAQYFPNHQIEAIIAKDKNAPTGTIPLGFDGRYQRIVDWNGDGPGDGI